MIMIISAPSDYRKAAERRLPRFLFDYIDGGAVTERTMKQNVEELASIDLRQRVLTGIGTPSLETQIFAQKWALPIALGLLAAMGVIPASEIAGYTALGELSLDSQVTAVAGVLPAALAASDLLNP